MIFDKTGTLTDGSFSVSDVVPLAGLNEDEVLAWAVSLESQPQHSIAQDTVRGAKERGVKANPVDSFRNITGQGAEAVVEGRSVRLVTPGYLCEDGHEVDNRRVEALGAARKTVVHVLFDDEPIGAVACERLDYNLLFRWFVGLSVDDPVWDHSTFTKN